MDSEGKVFSGEVPRELVSVLQSNGKDVVIQELEALAILIGMQPWQNRIQKRKLVVFTGSEAVKGGLLKFGS